MPTVSEPSDNVTRTVTPPAADAAAAADARAETVEDSTTASRARPKFDAAVSIYQRLFGEWGGACPTATLTAALKAAGIASRTAASAREELGFVSGRIPRDGYWTARSRADFELICKIMGDNCIGTTNLEDPCSSYPRIAHDLANKLQRLPSGVWVDRGVGVPGTNQAKCGKFHVFRVSQAKVYGYLYRCRLACCCYCSHQPLAAFLDGIPEHFRLRRWQAERADLPELVAEAQVVFLTLVPYAARRALNDAEATSPGVTTLHILLGSFAAPHAGRKRPRFVPTHILIVSTERFDTIRGVAGPIPWEPLPLQDTPTRLRELVIGGHYGRYSYNFRGLRVRESTATEAPEPPEPQEETSGAPDDSAPFEPSPDPAFTDEEWASSTDEQRALLLESLRLLAEGEELLGDDGAPEDDAPADDEVSHEDDAPDAPDETDAAPSFSDEWATEAPEEIVLTASARFDLAKLTIAAAWYRHEHDDAAAPSNEWLARILAAAEAGESVTFDLDDPADQQSWADALAAVKAQGVTAATAATADASP